MVSGMEERSLTAQRNTNNNDNNNKINRSNKTRVTIRYTAYDAIAHRIQFYCTM